ncbi:peptidoglycan editing factor PgeF [Altererythrobacter aurantiacus]|uniref:Purine nucleoside phosphorylase n=1 Tax=Parapontixanthobacter aurantiacus TaxID=1463599 RepID=A0A844ZHX3_9SPHN|nr:peptidoglycan editing factor PgeF [Parapontixanthobacter aurantiacus]MXO86726.1 peptidoglycan editing factor PgeF [Parapontixanthobacter aurantiacus]
MSEPLRSDLLSAVPHGFFGWCKPSGEAGEFDARQAANRVVAAEQVSPKGRLATVTQVHSARTVIVEQPFAPDAAPEADALVTATPQVLLGIVTADCAPVLLADVEARVIGAAHAGWRGAHGGVLESCVEAMIECGARRESIAAAIGPTIAQESYEVDDDFRARFDEVDEAFFRRSREGHWQFDLPHYVAARLRRAGVFAVDVTGKNTFAEADRYYSYRRASQTGEANDMRQISIIGLPVD